MIFKMLRMDFGFSFFSFAYRKGRYHPMLKSTVVPHTKRNSTQTERQVDNATRSALKRSTSCIASADLSMRILP